MAVAATLELCVEKTVALSEDQVAKTLPFLDVVRTLNDTKVKYVLVGAHGLSVWIKKPRATEDVDVIVSTKQVKKAVQALLDAFPELEAVDLPFVVRLRDVATQTVLIDVMKPLQQPHCEVLKHTKKLTTQGISYQVPTLEMALLMKFVAMTSPYRAEKDKYQDAHDFLYMVENNSAVNHAQVQGLADLVYPGAGKRIVEMIDQARKGERLVL